MKVLIALTLVTLSFNTIAACELNMVKKSEKSKTLYIEGVSISQNIRNVLSSQCKINVAVLNKEQVRQMNINALEKRLQKLKLASNK